MRIAFFLLIIIAGVGCASKAKVVQPSADNLSEDLSEDLAKDTVVELSSFTLQITPENLSEDGTEVSTKNDEILLILYADSTMTAPVLMKEFKFDDSMTTQSCTFETKDEKPLLVVLLEKDTEMSNSAIESMVRLQWQILSPLRDKGDAVAMEKLLGDDDLLGYKWIYEKDKPANFEIGGTHYFDRFLYAFSVRKL